MPLEHWVQLEVSLHVAAFVDAVKEEVEKAAVGEDGKVSDKEALEEVAVGVEVEVEQQEEMEEGETFRTH